MATVVEAVADAVEREKIMQENDYEEQDKTLTRGEMLDILVTQATHTICMSNRLF